ncbi:hypothetical protein ACQ4PT_021321 [Festuca glaucescens]
MSRVLYCARTRANPEPPYHAPPSRPAKTPAASAHGSATPSTPPSIGPAPQHVDLDGLRNSPASSPLPDPSQDESYCCYEYESDSEGECPPTPEPASPSFDPEDYSCGDGGFTPYLRNCPGYANIALEHYNSQDNHEIKYQLIKAIISCVIRYDGSYRHVNFTAKSTLENSKEDFFFAELRLCHHTHAWVPVCIVSLGENERVGGFSEIRSRGVDPRHCFGCGDVVKHPVDGSLYEAGHYLVDGYWFHRYVELLPASEVQD